LTARIFKKLSGDTRMEAATRPLVQAASQPALTISVLGPPTTASL